MVQTLSTSLRVTGTTPRFRTFALPARFASVAASTQSPPATRAYVDTPPEQGKPAHPATTAAAALHRSMITDVQPNKRTPS